MLLLGAIASSNLSRTPPLSLIISRRILRLTLLALQCALFWTEETRPRFCLNVVLHSFCQVHPLHVLLFEISLSCQTWPSSEEFGSYTRGNHAPGLRRVTAQPQSRLKVSVLVQMIVAVNGFDKVT